MRTRKGSKEPKTMPPNPGIAGIGLIALDMVWSSDRSGLELFAGGTCGNVLAILAFLGWKAMPIGRIGEDIAGELVKDDLARWGADLSCISLKPTAKTPVIVEKIRRDRNGIPFHTFSFHCPSCSRRFPGFQAVPACSIEVAIEMAGAADVLFIDRASKSSVLLAEAVSKAGGMIVFEPASIVQSRSSAYLLETANVVKYSHDRIDELPQSDSKTRFLEIQTLGRGGLRFKTRGTRNWQHMQAEPVEQIVDAAGSGDWLTAGFLYALHRRQTNSHKKLGVKEIVQALALGQKLAAWNCKYRGARGGMYTADKSRIASIVAEGLSASVGHRHVTWTGSDEPNAVADVCLNCSSSRVQSVQPTVRARVLASGNRRA